MDYKIFSFTMAERKSIILFFIILLLLFGTFRYFYNKVTFSSTDFDPSEYYIPADSVIVKNTIAVDYDETNDLFYNSADKKIQIPSQTFAFNPNDISVDSLMLLGFSKFGATSLVNFRSKGGKIRNEAKFKSVYGIDTSRVNELKDYITYTIATESRKDSNQVVNTYKKPTYEPKTIEINTADSLDWVQFRGVGPYTASRILAYRTKLGGFIELSQLLEVAAVKDSIYQSILPYLQVNSDIIKKININTADFKEFVQHPYFDKEVVNKILKYRDQHGSFTDPTHIRKIKSLKEESGKRILPYLRSE